MIKIYLDKFISYYKVGALLHYIALVNFVLGTFLSITFKETSPLFMSTAYVFWLFGISFFFTNLVLSEMDAWSRYQNYKQLKDQIIMFGFQERLLKPMLHSRCQRDAAVVACQELNLEKESNSYFSRFGYKWYHIIPDFVFQYPLFFFSSFFWRTTFFTPYYKSKMPNFNPQLNKMVNTRNIAS